MTPGPHPMGFGQFAAFGTDPFASYNPFATDPRAWGSPATPAASMTGFTFQSTLSNPRHPIGSPAAISQTQFGFGLEHQHSNLVPGAQTLASSSTIGSPPSTFANLNHQAQSFANAMMCAPMIDSSAATASLSASPPLVSSGDPGLAALRRKALEQSASMNSFSALSNCGFDLR